MRARRKRLVAQGPSSAKQQLEMVINIIIIINNSNNNNNNNNNNSKPNYRSSSSCSMTFFPESIGARKGFQGAFRERDSVYVSARAGFSAA